MRAGRLRRNWRWTRVRPNSCSSTSVRAAIAWAARSSRRCMRNWATKRRISTTHSASRVSSRRSSSSMRTRSCSPITIARTAVSSQRCARWHSRVVAASPSTSTTLVVDPARLDVDGHERQGDMLAGDLPGRILAALFNEEPGAVLQVRKSQRDAVMAVLRKAGLGAMSQSIGYPNSQGEIRVVVNGKAVLAEKRSGAASRMVRSHAPHAAHARQPRMCRPGI